MFISDTKRPTAPTTALPTILSKSKVSASLHSFSEDNIDAKLLSVVVTPFVKYSIEEY